MAYNESQIYTAVGYNYTGTQTPWRRSIGALSDGTIIAIFDQEDGDGGHLFYSEDQGDTWDECSSGSPYDDNNSYFNGQGAMFIDVDDNIWLIYNRNSSNDVWCVRGVFSSGAITWDTKYAMSAADSTATKYGFDGVAFKIGSDIYVVSVALTTGGPQRCITKYASGGTYSRIEDEVDLGSYAAGTLCLDFNHTGDGKTVKNSTPHLYMGQIQASAMKYWYSAYSTGPSWNQTPTERTLRSASGIDYGGNCGGLLFDGTRIVMVCGRDDYYFYVYERDAADTTTTARYTATTLGYAGSSGADFLGFYTDKDENLYIVGQDPWTPTNVGNLSFAKYIRGTDTWDTDWTDPSSGIDTQTNRGMVSCYPVDNVALGFFVSVETGDDDVQSFSWHQFNVAPTAPTWTTTTGETRDVAETLLLDWVFNDADGDAQSDYTIRKREGTGSYEYWNGTGWQASEDASTKIASSVSSKTLAASWGADGDDDHYYAIKTWDPDDAVSPWSTELRVIPSAQDNPTITAPTGTVGPTATATWTATTQTAYRVVVSDTSSTTNMDAGTLEYDSGWVVDEAKTAELEFPTNTVTRYFRVMTKNDEGLESDIDQETLTVSYTPPSTPTLAITEPVAGGLKITIDNPAGGSTVGSNEVYRRVGTGEWIRRASGVAVDGNFTDWAVTGGVTYEYKIRALGTNGSWTEGSATT